jgi:selenocysteine lyase/cysteine desulfurase
MQTTRFREDAREIIRTAVGGDARDCVIFAGSGATGAINKLIDILNLRLPADLDARYHLASHIPEDERPVVFIGPYEHHSNELPWRESIARVITIDEDADGHINLASLEKALIENEKSPLKIGSFSAASNVTGIGTNTLAISTLLHQHGALAFWDFAAAAPYVKMEMNPVSDGPDAGLGYKDALFLSPHKFIGGPGTPGVLVVKRALLKNRVPSIPGGGTVAYVNSVTHQYITDPVHREEGGTPAIIESIRAGLVFQLKDAVGHELIREREGSFIQRAIQSWSANDDIRILGNRQAWRLSIVSFIVKHGQGALHHNFVVSLLNDLFGIQARGGCSCAGPYGHRLLGIDLLTSHAFECAIVSGAEGIKPGWVRVNFNYFISEQVFDFILKAVHFVAREGYKFLPHYRFDLASGQWLPRRARPKPAMRLSDLSYRMGKLEYKKRHATEPEWALEGYLADAERIVKELETEFAAAPLLVEEPLPADIERLRWFPLPGEILCEMKGVKPATHCSGLGTAPH